MSIARHPLILFGTKPAAGGAFDTDYQAILTYVATGLPSYAEQVKQNQLMVDLKAALGLANIDAMVVFNRDGSNTYKAANWKNPGSGTNWTFNNSPTINTAGVYGNGSTANAQSAQNWEAGLYSTENSIGFIVVPLTNLWSTGDVIVSSVSLTFRNHLRSSNGTQITNGAINAGAGITGITLHHAKAVIVTRNNSEGKTRVRHNGIDTEFTDVNDFTTSNAIRLFEGSNHGAALFIKGANIWENRVAIETAINNYMTS